MGRCYEQLSLGERVRIELWRAEGRSLRWMACVLGRSASTLSREVRRNSRRTRRWPGGYDGDRAHGLAVRRRQWDKRFKLARQPALRALVRDGLAMGRSPEQIAGRLAHEHGKRLISHESIYRFIYHRSTLKDYWHRLLPRAKSRRGRLGQRGGSPPA
jgi:IS30 family transposase